MRSAKLAVLGIAALLVGLFLSPISQACDGLAHCSGHCNSSAIIVNPGLGHANTFVAPFAAQPFGSHAFGHSFSHQNQANFVFQVPATGVQPVFVEPFVGSPYVAGHAFHAAQPVLGLGVPVHTATQAVVLRNRGNRSASRSTIIVNPAHTHRAAITVGGGHHAHIQHHSSGGGRRALLGSGGGQRIDVRERNGILGNRTTIRIRD